MSESDQRRLLGASEDDVEVRGSELALAVVNGSSGNNNNNRGFRDLLRLSGHRHSFKHIDKEGDRDRDRDRDRRDQNRHLHDVDLDSSVDVLGDSAPPEWALLLIGCLIGLTTGLFVALFNKGVCQIFFLFWLISTLSSFSLTDHIQDSPICSYQGFKLQFHCDP